MILGRCVIFSVPGGYVNEREGTGRGLFVCLGMCRHFGGSFEIVSSIFCDFGSRKVLHYKMCFWAPGADIA